MFEGKKLICPITLSKRFQKLFTIKKFPIFMGVVKKNKGYEYKNMNFYINKDSGTVQIFPRIPLKKLYSKSHYSGTTGKLWKRHHINFFDFLKKEISGNVLEIGGGHNSISKSIDLESVKNIKCLTSVDPNGEKLKRVKHKLIKNFFSKKIFNQLKKKNDLVIHSHLFEHIYDPVNFLIQLKSFLTPKALHIFSVPNIKKMIQSGYANGMNFEHPYFLEEDLIDYLLKRCGYKILKKKYFYDHSIFYKTAVDNSSINKKIRYNKFNLNKEIFLNFIKKIKFNVKKINSSMSKLDNSKIFLFGAHIFSQILILNKLNQKKIFRILDNDPYKQNNYLYGTKFKVESPDVLKKYYKPAVILRAANYSREIKNQIRKLNKGSIFI
jgi:2-polyprenyl-3-methyl-5-hydroxy-6-metoxy-1,4-benzoquinol methylase